MLKSMASESADYLYKVVSGTVRTYKVLTDGRRQIGAFYLPGDIFGLESGDEHDFSAEAITTLRCSSSSAARWSHWLLATTALPRNFG